VETGVRNGALGFVEGVFISAMVIYDLELLK